MVVALVAAAAAPAAAPALRFERAFATGDAPRTFHAQVVYRGPDGVHRMELWRDGTARLRRDTDARLVTVARRPRAGPAFRLDLYDTRRRIHTVIDRDSLYRVGRFTDWDDLAHGLRHPAGAYRLRALDRAPAPVATAAPCRWYALESQGRTTSICWSRTYAFPIAMLDAGNRPIWRTVALDTRAPAAALFRPDDAGYVLDNATADISND